VIDERTGAKHISGQRLMSLLAQLHPDVRIFATASGDLVVMDSKRELMLHVINLALEETFPLSLANG
jgi:hypothetical protein